MRELLVNSNNIICSNTSAILQVLCIIVGISLLIFSSPVYAYTPHVGDRAAPILGLDVISKEVVCLDDYLGEWCLLEFWSSTCRPCMRSLPSIISETQPYVDQHQLKILLVNLDRPQDVESMKDKIREMDLKCPVIYTGGMSVVLGPPISVSKYRTKIAPQAQEWGISTIPANYLINPQGVIVAKNLKPEGIREVLEFFICNDQPNPTIGLRTCAIGEADNVELLIELYSSEHIDVRTRVFCRFVNAEYSLIDSTGEKTFKKRIRTGSRDVPLKEFIVEFNVFGDEVVVVPIDATGYQGIEYRVEAMIPESDKYLNNLGIWINQSGSLYFDLAWASMESSR